MGPVNRKPRSRSGRAGTGGSGQGRVSGPKGIRIPASDRYAARRLKEGAGREPEPRLLQIVGFKNSGKTTLTESLLRQALGLGWRASAIKRHGHGGAPEPPPEETDASRFFAAGAASSLVAGGGVLLLQGRQPEEQIDDLAALIRLTQAAAAPDLILIEGFKEQPHAKLALVRCAEDWAELRRLANIRLVVAVDEALARRLRAEAAEAPYSGAPAGGGEAPPPHTRIPRIVSRDDTEDIAAWFAGWLRGDHHESL